MLEIIRRVCIQSPVPHSLADKMSSEGKFFNLRYARRRRLCVTVFVHVDYLSPLACYY